MNHIPPKQHYRVSVFAILAALAALLGTPTLPTMAQSSESTERQPTESDDSAKFEQSLRSRTIELLSQLQNDTRKRLFIQPGLLKEAQDYYGRISGILNFSFDDSSLDSLLAYMGYCKPKEAGSGFSGLLAVDLETIRSFALMPQNASEFATLKGLVSDPNGFDDLLNPSDFRRDRVLVSRFFAPKIATYYDSKDPHQPINRDDIVPGWRKLVRLKVRSGSQAKAAGLEHMYLLFNYKEQDPDVDPFEGKESANNQVILVPEDQSTNDSCYFAVYNARSGGYPIGYSLKADFDLPGHVGVIVPGAADGEYFVPRSCAECHGHSGGALNLIGQPIDENGRPTNDFASGSFRFTKPNYLDTDQWYDWMEFDFRGVTTSLNDVVFDGGKAHGSPEYDRAFDVIRTINEDIRDETFAAEQVPGQKSYQTFAAERWLALHERDSQRIPYSARSIGNQAWDVSNRDEMRLLRLLDNHCFRCHSSLRYNVFDRQKVAELKPVIQFYLTDPVFDSNGNPLPGFRMPQGRVLVQEERDEIIRLLNNVFP